MFETLKRLFFERKIVESQLSGAVKNDWITQEQMEYIKGMPLPTTLESEE